MAKIALIETKPGSRDFGSDFGIQYDRYALCSDPTIKKVLKADVDIEIDIDSYDWIILVGSEPLKHYTKINSITTYTGKRVEEKFLPVINPSMLAFKPEARDVWEGSVANIKKYIAGTAVEASIDDKVRGIETEEEALEYIQKAIDCTKYSFFGMDSETSALYARDGYVLGISLCYDPEAESVYISADCITEEVEIKLQELITKKIPIFHNAKFDIAMLEYHFNLLFDRFEDTMLLHYLINENVPHGLKELAMKFTPYGDYEKPLEDWKEQYCKANGIKKADFSYDLIPFDVMYPYAAGDSLVTLMLFIKFKKILENKKLKNVYDRLLIPGTRMLVDIQNNGVPFHKERLVHSQLQAEQEIAEAFRQLYEFEEVKNFMAAEMKDFNPNSVIQLRKLLFDYCGIRPTGKKTATGALSTDAEVLQQLSEEHPVPGLILDIRQKGKIKNTYLDKIIPQLDKDSRLRTNFNLHITTSGRLSSSGKLNMQQLPRDNPTVKGCIRAAEGRSIVAMDLTTAEVYVAAVLAEDQALMEVFRSGGNFHSTIAHKVFRLPCSVEEVVELYADRRQAAKAVTFGIMYGAGAAKISEQVTKDSGKYFSRDEAQEVIDQYFQEFHRLKKWIDESRRFIEVNKFVYSYFGRKRRLLNVDSTDRGTAGSTIRSGLNFLVQSTASDINLLAAIDMNSYIKSTGMDAKIFALVHDSILADVSDEFVDEYKDKLQGFVQLDRGIMIPGAPIGCDFDVGQDYAFGKYEKMYGDNV